MEYQSQLILKNEHSVHIFILEIGMDHVYYLTKDKLNIEYEYNFFN